MAGLIVRLERSVRMVPARTISRSNDCPILCVPPKFDGSIGRPNTVAIGCCPDYQGSYGLLAG